MTSQRKTLRKSLPDGTYIEVYVEMREAGGQLSPGFSVSGALWEKRGTWSGKVRASHGRDCDAGGQITDELRSAFPQLAPLLDIHLADLDGTPMHARANGWYFYSASAREYEDRQYGPDYAARLGTDHERAARALHIPPADLPTGLDRVGFDAFVDTLTERWLAQAEAARAAFDALPDES